VQGAERVVGEQCAVGSRCGEPVADVFGSIRDGCRCEQEAMMDTREQRPMRTMREVCFEFGQSHENEREKRLGISFSGDSSPAATSWRCRRAACPILFGGSATLACFGTWCASSPARC
jgi:hypothetical protein